MLSRIQALVDLINHHHPLFSTISSCSGWITLFDLNGVSTGVNEELPDGMKATSNKQWKRHRRLLVVGEP
jgi:tRNA(Phe) wybutosine-synthesizing methylase Tyw3